jgi:hypothetical protein
MAYLYVRPNGRVEIREAHSTPRGPRSRTLVGFRGDLTEETLDRAESVAARPFDREALRARARELGIGVAPLRADAAARALVTRMRRGAALDPAWATLLRRLLEERPEAPVPDALADVLDWVGASDRERGRALRDVLRLYDRIARSRPPVREAEQERFPRFQVRPARRAS